MKIPYRSAASQLMRMLMAPLVQKRAVGHILMMLWISRIRTVACLLISTIQLRKKTFTLRHNSPGLSNLTKYNSYNLSDFQPGTFSPQLNTCYYLKFWFLFSVLPRLVVSVFCMITLLSLWNGIKPAAALAASLHTAWAWARLCRSFHSLMS